MTFFTGDSGRLWLADTDSQSFEKCANVQSWGINWSQTMIQRDALGYTDRVITPGIRQLSGTARILYYRDPPNNNGGDGISLPNEGVSWLMQKIIKVDSDAYDGTFPPTDAGGDPRERQSARLGFKLGLTGGGTNRFLSFYGYINSFTMNCNVGEVVAADVSFEADGAPFKNTF